MNNLSVRRIYSVRLVFAVALILFALWRHYRINQDIRYTIAITTKHITTPRNNAQIEYTFSVSGVNYMGYAPDLVQYQIKFPGGRYYLKFPLKSPASNDILWDRPVPDSVKTAPVTGWKDLP
jgi:hypothetical protein